MDIDYSTLPKRSILCVDVKSFFASVEAVRRKIHPLDAYIVVVANKQRPGAVVLASSPLVKREFGINTGSRAYSIPNDPRLIIVEPSMKFYLKVNNMIMNIYKRFVSDDDLHVYSIDEALIDVTASEKLFGDKFEIAHKIQRTIFKELKLIVTIGIGDNPLLSKLALDNQAKNAANGLAYWSYDNIKDTVWKIPNLKDMWGISSGYITRLQSMGINSVYDLAHADKYKLKEKFGVLGLQMFYHSWGVDYTILSEKVETKSKSYSKSQILMRDYYNEREILIVIHEMVDEVAMRLRSHRVSAGKIALAISYSRDIEERGFKHQMQLPRHTNCTKDLNTQFEKLFKKHWRGQPVRQIFVVCGKLEPALYEQIDLFSTNEELEKKHALDEAMDEIRFRFGKSSIFWAHSLLPAGTFLKRANTIGGHKG